MMRPTNTAIALALSLSAALGAQEPDIARGRPQRGGGGMAAARQAIERLIRTQVQPTDAQMQQLRAIDRRYEPLRLALNSEEGQVRRELRQAMMDTTNVDQNRIGQLVDQMVAFPGRRAALMQEESRAIAGVLTPLQRARYHAIQEQLRRRIEQGRGGPGRGRPPGTL